MADESTPSVLVVDDDLRLARALGRMLTHLGLDVTVADDGYSALQRLEERRFDVLVLDLRMPGWTGSTCSAVRRGIRIFRRRFFTRPTWMCRPLSRRCEPVRVKCCKSR